MGRRWRARAAAILALVWLAGCATTAGPGPAALAKPSREVLPNGVVVIVQEHRASPVVALQLWMRMGGRDEAANELGLAHYIEHMLFKGTPTRPPGSIDTMIEGFGGVSNAYTSYDTTHYDFVVPVEHLRAGVELLADLATHASFPPAEIDNEKKVVFEEMNLLEDDPEKFLLRRLYEVSYSPHPYGRPLLGEREFIQKLTRPSLMQFYQKHFVPKDMVLVVVGATDAARVRPIVDATFGRIPAAPTPPRQTPPVPTLDRARRADVRRTEQQAYLGLAWKTAPTGSEDIYAVDLLTYIIGDSPSSRLNQVVREQLRLVANIEAGYGAFQQSGLVTVTARLDPGNLDRAEAAIMDVIRRVRTEGVTEAERQRAVVTAESSYAFDIETAEGLAKSYGQAETTWTLDNELAYLTRLRGITAVQIQAVARKYFGDDNYARVRFIPQGAPR
jgi:zinc protease